jgi:hypothetical protein
MTIPKSGPILYSCANKHQEVTLKYRNDIPTADDLRDMAHLLIMTANSVMVKLCLEEKDIK